MFRNSLLKQGCPQCWPVYPINALDKSKLMLHTGKPVVSALSHKIFADKRCSSSRRPARKPCCSSGCSASSTCSNLPRRRYANVLYNNRTFAIGLKSVVCFALAFVLTSTTYTFYEMPEQDRPMYKQPFLKNVPPASPSNHDWTLGFFFSIRSLPPFFPRALLSAECSVARTVVLVNLQACGRERCLPFLYRRPPDVHRRGPSPS